MAGLTADAITRSAESGSTTITLGVYVSCLTERVGPGSVGTLVCAGAGGAGKAGVAGWGEAAA